MRCAGWTPADLPADLRKLFIFVRLSGAESLPANAAALLQAAQHQDLMELVDNRHQYFQLSRLNMTYVEKTNAGIQALQCIGRTVAAALPGGKYNGARAHVYCGAGAGMSAHRDRDGAALSF